EVPDRDAMGPEADGRGCPCLAGVPGHAGAPAEPAPGAGRPAERGGTAGQGPVPGQGAVRPLPPGRVPLHLEEELRRQAAARRQPLRHLEPAVAAPRVRPRAVPARRQREHARRALARAARPGEAGRQAADGGGAPGPRGVPGSPVIGTAGPAPFGGPAPWASPSLTAAAWPT